MELVLATGNPHKAEEIQHLLRPYPMVKVHPAEHVGGMPRVEETAEDFRGNALLKAQALVGKADGKIVLADDSGLCVDALDGLPGVRSARYAGEGASDADNMDKVLRELKGFSQRKRTAAFICVLCLLWPGRKEPYFFEGQVEGFLTDTPRGEFGFGYDPIFIPRDYSKTFGELGPDVKNRLSHRSKALKSLRSWIGEVLRG